MRRSTFSSIRWRFWRIAGAASLLAGILTLADTVVLNTGESITGTVVDQGDLEVVIDTPNQGRLTLPALSVNRVERTGVPGPLPPAPVEPEALDSLLQTSIPVPLHEKHPAGNPIPYAPRPTLPEGTNFVARAYWDGNLRYQLSTRLILKDPLRTDSTWVDNRLRLRGHIGSKLAVDGAAFAVTDGQLDVPGGIQVRKFSVLTDGEFGVWLTNQFSIELGLVDGSFYLTKAYYRIVDLPHVGDLTVGYFSAPQTLENIMSYGSLTFMEPSAGTAAFSPGNRSGIEWNTACLDERVTAAAGIFSLGQDPNINFGNASDALAQPIVRFTGLPWTDRDRWMHIGVSAALVFSGNSDIQYQARPESRLAPFLVNTSTIEARTAAIGGLEWIQALGPVLLQSEYVSTAVFRDAGNLRFQGGYFAGGWMLTGESRPYNRFIGIPTRVRPEHPLWGPNSGWGAWEAAGRISIIDLTDGDVSGGRMRILMGGLNWYWNQYIRWQLNAGYAAVSGGPTPGNLLIFEARFESQF
ncbi:MAG: porin [Verrucomicrobiota bacterium]